MKTMFLDVKKLALNSDCYEMEYSSSESAYKLLLDQVLNCYGLNKSERREWRVDFQTRLESSSLYELIKDDLTTDDLEKIAINKRVFLG